jgi:predicted nucleic acid-binding protein
VILVDTSVWVDHLRAADQTLADLLNRGMVLTHPFVIGGLALGVLRQRALVLDALSDLPQASVATDTEVLQFIDRHRLFGRGIGYIDAHLLAAVLLTMGATLWTHDKRLHSVAESLGVAMMRSKR